VRDGEIDRIGPTSDDWRLLGIDLTQLLRSGDAREPMLMHLFERLDQLVDGRRLVWAVEEFHAGWAIRRDAPKSMTNCAWRKRNAMAILVSQNPTDASCAIAFVEILLARLALSLVILVGPIFLALAASRPCRQSR
jgi:type IV secretory pathway VirB4 component